MTAAAAAAAEYARLGGPDADPESPLPSSSPSPSTRRFCCCEVKDESLRWWGKVAVGCVFLAAAAAVIIVFCVPFFINKMVIPILNWEMATFSTLVIGLLIFASIALFPLLLLPSFPAIWLAGITFGYGYGFILIMAGTSIGVSLPFFTGSLFSYRIHIWLEKWPEKSAIVRLAGEGDWFHQFKAVALLRISPFPYILFNYAAVATKTKYGPYLLGSLLGVVPDTFLTIYSGRLLRSLADDASERGGHLSLQQVLFVALSISVGLAASAAITFYAKRALLQSLQVEDELGCCKPVCI